MTDNLPPLPDRIIAYDTFHQQLEAYSAEQMQSYARAALAQAQSCVPADGYTAQCIEALQENGDPVSIDAAEEMQRLHQLLAASTQPQPVQPSEQAIAEQYLALCDAMGYSSRADNLQSPEEFAEALVAQAKPEQAAQPEKDQLHDDIQSVLFEVEQAIENGVCPWQIEVAFEAYEAARRLQLPAHGIAAPQPKD